MDNPNSSFKETPNWLKWSLTFRCDSCKQGRSSSENSGGREVIIQGISKEKVFLLFLTKPGWGGDRPPYPPASDGSVKFT